MRAFIKYSFTCVCAKLVEKYIHMSNAIMDVELGSDTQNLGNLNIETQPINELINIFSAQSNNRDILMLV